MVDDVRNPLQAEMYAQLSDWQFQRGINLMDQAARRDALREGHTILDIGCGTGGLTRELARRAGSSGRVIAIDPDRDRIELALGQTPASLTNIAYHQAFAEQLPFVEPQSVDFAYSNYVFHWVVDKDAALQALRRCLRPGGQIGVECCEIALAPVLEEVTALNGESGQRLLARFQSLDLAGWKAAMARHNIALEEINLLDLEYEFPDLPALLAWWQGTTHGVVRTENFSPAAMQKMYERFPGKVEFRGPSIRFFARIAE